MIFLLLLIIIISNSIIIIIIIIIIIVIIIIIIIISLKYGKYLAKLKLILLTIWPNLISICTNWNNIQIPFIFFRIMQKLKHFLSLPFYV